MQAVWSEALERVAEGLSAGRRWLWDEAARKVGILLAAPAAFEGEHFLQAWLCARCQPELVSFCPSRAWHTCGA